MSNRLTKQDIAVMSPLFGMKPDQLEAFISEQEVKRQKREDKLKRDRENAYQRRNDISDRFEPR